MDYQQFKETVVEGLKNIYPNATVSLASVEKNNGIELDGVVIREEGQNISPNIYLLCPILYIFIILRKKKYRSLSSENFMRVSEYHLEPLINKVRWSNVLIYDYVERQN